MRLTFKDKMQVIRRLAVVAGLRKGWIVPAAAVSISMAISACGSAATPSGAIPSGQATRTSVTHGSLTIAVFDPFEGAEAAIGPGVEAECYAAATVFNDSGGLLGHKVQCTPFDSTSDPADAVPVATRLLATSHNLILVDGPGSEEPAVEPLLNNAKVIHFAWNGLPSYDHQTSPYFYRPFPSDTLGGVADALYLIKQGYTRAAGVFDNSAGAQAQVPNLVHTYAKLGHKLVVKLELAPSSTYSLEAHQVVSAKPDAIMSELDTPQEVEAWYSALASLSNGKFPPLVPTESETTSTTNWIQLVTHALGTQALKNVVEIGPGGSLNPAGYPTFKRGLLTAPESIKDRQQFLGLDYIAQGYDAIITDGLAIDEAKSTNSAKVSPLIAQIADGTPGAVTVGTYAQGARAIAQGHKVHYIGAGGALLFNNWHNLVAPFQISRYAGSKAGWVAIPSRTITVKEIDQAAQ